MEHSVYEKLMRCYQTVKEKVDFQPKVALVLGSGLGDYADRIEMAADRVAPLFRKLVTESIREIGKSLQEG